MDISAGLPPNTRRVLRVFQTQDGNIGVTDFDNTLEDTAFAAYLLAQGHKAILDVRVRMPSIIMPPKPG